MEHVVSRRAELKDVPELAELFHSLWPEASVAEHAKEVAALLADNFPGPLPVLVFLAEEVGCRPIRFIEVDLRSHADALSYGINALPRWTMVMLLSKLAFATMRAAV